MKEIILYNILAAALAGAVLIPLASAAYAPYKTQKDKIYRAADSGGDSLRALMAEGISINSIDENGSTALMDAAHNHNDAIVQTLVSNGADVNMQNNAGETALMLAAEEGDTKVVCILLDANADPNIRDRKGETALEKAEESGYYDTSGTIGRSGGH